MEYHGEDEAQHYIGKNGGKAESIGAGYHADEKESTGTDEKHDQKSVFLHTLWGLSKLSSLETHALPKEHSARLTGIVWIAAAISSMPPKLFNLMDSMSQT